MIYVFNGILIQSKRIIQIRDLQLVDESIRRRIALQLFRVCNSDARNSLLNDPNDDIRSIAVQSQINLEGIHHECS